MRLAAAVGVLGSLILLAAPVSQAQAQSWPHRPVRFIIPFGPGAGADIGARLIQERLQKKWGQPVVIENRPGGDSIIAIQAVLSANDDHTFLWGPSGNFIVHPFQYKKLPYDPNDIVPTARFSSTILSIGVPTSMKIKTVAEFVKAARANDGKFNSAAVPGITELAQDYFMLNHKINTQKVPYKDIVQAGTDLGEGRLQVYSSSYAIQRPHHEGGRITVLAHLGKVRAPSLAQHPDRHRGRLSRARDGRQCRPVRQQGRARRIGRTHRQRHRRGLERQDDRRPRSTRRRRRRRAAAPRNSPRRSPSRANIAKIAKALGFSRRGERRRQ